MKKTISRFRKWSMKSNIAIDYVHFQTETLYLNALSRP